MIPWPVTQRVRVKKIVIPKVDERAELLKELDTRQRRKRLRAELKERCEKQKT